MSRRSMDMPAARRAMPAAWLTALLLSLVLPLVMTPGMARAQARTTPDVTSVTADTIRDLLAHRPGPLPEGAGIIVGAVDAAGTRVVADGMRAKGGSQPIDAETVFEIGSISKVFTSLLLADMVQRGEVALTDPVQKYLPATVKMPTRGGKQITLEDLATHSSGLPRLPANLNPANPANPYADYSVEQLYAFLSAHTLARDIGAQYEYSNLGAGLLGHALARRAGMDYEALVRARITGPLGMTRTAIAFTPDMKSRLATGYDASMTAVGYWDLPTLAGAGGLRSTMTDMLKFVSAALGVTKSPLAPAFAAMTKVRRPANGAMEVALGWHVASRDGQPIYWHNGGTAGFRTYAGFDPARGTGIVVLSNTSGQMGVDFAGMALLGVKPGAPPSQTQGQSAAAAASPAQGAAVDPTLLESYVGRYQLARDFILTVTRENAQLFGQATGQPRFELFPEAGAAHTFFAKVAAIKVTFEPDAQGRVARLALQQDGGTVRASRLAEGGTAGASAASGAPTAAAPKERKAIALDAAIFDRYAGRYRIVEGMDVTFTREGDRFYTQVTGQPKVELFAESEREFFLRVVDAQVTFSVDAQGRATEALLKQNGAERVIKRIE